MNEFIFVTGNMNKVKWLEKSLGRKVEHAKLDLMEVQSLDAAVVLENKTKEAYLLLGKPVLVEDVSLIFHSMGQLPGPLIKWFNDELGDQGICKMLDGFDDRSATAFVSYGLFDGKKFYSYQGVVEGKVADAPKGSGGFGWDCIFIPKGHSKTLSEMDEEEYKSITARHDAAIKLKKFLDN